MVIAFEKNSRNQEKYTNHEGTRIAFFCLSKFCSPFVCSSKWKKLW